jgi:hypothetical protein
MSLKKILSTGLLAFGGMVSAQAQQASCDMAVTLVSPAAGAVVNAYATYNITVTIKNNGPDALETGDTLYYNTPSMFALATAPYVLTQDIPSGNSATITLTSAVNVNENTEDVTTDYCVKVLSKPTNDGPFVDPNLNNNSSCNSVTFKPVGPTSVNELQQGRNSLKLFPNPVNGTEIRLATGNKIAGAATVMIRDIAGRELSRQVLQIASNTENVRLDVSRLVPGLYFVEIHQEQGRFSGRFVKQ